LASSQSNQSPLWRKIHDIPWESVIQILKNEGQYKLDVPVWTQFISVLSAQLLIKYLVRIKIHGSVSVLCAFLNYVHGKIVKHFKLKIQFFTGEYTCNGWWEEAGLNYLIVTSLSAGNPKFCFRIHELVLELSPQELRKKELTFTDNYDDDENSGSQLHSRKIFQFSRFAESCGRGEFLGGVIPDLQFNTTSYGTVRLIRVMKRSSGTKLLNEGGKIREKKKKRYEDKLNKVKESLN
jgi:hypothetical protein